MIRKQILFIFSFVTPSNCSNYYCTIYYIWELSEASVICHISEDLTDHHLNGKGEVKGHDVKK